MVRSILRDPVMGHDTDTSDICAHTNLAAPKSSEVVFLQIWYSVLLNPARGLLQSLCASVRVSVCVSVCLLTT